MRLIDESAPGIASFVAENYPQAVRYSADRLPFLIAEAVTHGVIVFPLNGPAPKVAEFIAETDVVAFSEAEKALLEAILKTEKAAWSRFSNLLAPIDHV